MGETGNVSAGDSAASSLSAGDSAASSLSAAGIEAARSLIDPVFLDSPQFHSDALSAWTDARVLVKLECINPIRSFKGRGACTFTERHHATAASPWLCASAGNFGQGLAYALREHDIPLIVYAARNANAFKVDKMRALGAEVRLEGDDFDASKQACRERAVREGLTFIEDGKDPAITEGAGTVAMELTAWNEPLDAVLIPVGNGALVNGMGTWLRARSSATRVIGVGASGAPAMERSFHNRRVEVTESVSTRADGVATRVPVAEAVATMIEVVDEMLLVSEEEIAGAVDAIRRELGIVSEPAGAVPLAAARKHSARFRDQRIAVIVSGSNV